MAQEAFLRAFRKLASWRQDRPSPPGSSRWRPTSSAPSFAASRPSHSPSTKFAMSQPILAPSTADSNSATRARQFTMPCRAFRRSIARYSRSIIFTRRMFPRPRAVLSSPEGTVKAHLFRARNLLREKLKPLVQDRAAPDTNPTRHLGQMQDKPPLPLTTRSL